jgi:hypothetical protein
MVGDVNDAEVPKISRSIIFGREAMWETMWKKISSPFAVYAIEKSISVPRLSHGSSCKRRMPCSRRLLGFEDTQFIMYAKWRLLPKATPQMPRRVEANGPTLMGQAGLSNR